MTAEEFAALNAQLRPVPFGMRPVFIYCLCDPDTLEARYIGKSIRPLQRLGNHMQERSNCHRSHWLQSLRARGVKPVMVILERVDGAWPWQESERFWIAYGRHLGWPLTNNTSGGDGVPDLPPETRDRMRSVWLGRKHSPESLRKIGAASASRRHSGASRERTRCAMAGRAVTWRDKLSASLMKLSEAEQAVVEARLRAGERVTDLARELGLHRTTVSKIKKGKYRDQRRN